MPDQKEWTLMFYFASDNPLAPSVIPQLKALKSAGFHLDVNVVLQFDPNVAQIPTHVFDVNKMNKIALAHSMRNPKDEAEEEPAPYQFWGSNDPYIRNLVLDKLWDNNERETELREKVNAYVDDKYPGAHPETELPVPRIAKPGPNGTARAEGSETGAAPEPAPVNSLGDFLDFCLEKYPARHYMLFLLGHGLIVGNDMFLFDEHALGQYLTLRQLGSLMTKFKEKALELIGFHSCGLSGLEIACELEGSAKYMIASQGSEFVGSWPYREILIRVFNDVIKKKPNEDEEGRIKTTIEKVFSYILRSSNDFQMAGYSFDLCLSDVRGVGLIAKQLGVLAGYLKEAILPEDTEEKKKLLTFFQERVLLAHWRAQSYWGESYTDLYDFCLCLRDSCQFSTPPEGSEDLSKKIVAAAGDLMSVLESEAKADKELLEKNKPWPIVRAEFAGPEYQYSHGLSVYFPWSRPTDSDFWQKEYREYKFNRDTKGTSWADFLDTYWNVTCRATIGDETGATAGKAPIEQALLEEITSRWRDSNLFLGLSQDGSGDNKVGGSAGLGQGTGEPKVGGSAGLGTKVGGSSATGAGGDCPSIKNYPVRTFPTSPTFYKGVKRSASD